MKKRRENGDYAAISVRHKEIVQSLCDPDAGASDWDAFFAEIRAYVTVHFTKRLKDEAGIELEDFIHGELMEYFAARLSYFMDLTFYKICKKKLQSYNGLPCRS